MSDETLLYEAGAYLHKRHIPFILAVIPVYLNPENGEKVYLADKPKMVSVLKKLQQMGGKDHYSRLHARIPIQRNGRRL